jgi:hypothetical protein
MMISSGAPRSPNIFPSFGLNLPQPDKNGYPWMWTLIFH